MFVISKVLCGGKIKRVSYDLIRAKDIDPKITRPFEHKCENKNCKLDNQM